MCRAFVCGNTTAVDASPAEGYGLVPEVKEIGLVSGAVRTGEDGQPFAAVVFANRLGVGSRVVAPVTAIGAPDPAGSRLVRAGALSAHADTRSICKFSQSDSQSMALRPALSTTIDP